MDIKKREKLALGCYSGANVSLRVFNGLCKTGALIYGIGLLLTLVGDYQSKKIRKINSKR